MTEPNNGKDCCQPLTQAGWNVEDEVRDRYAAGANSVEPALCCPVSYDAEYLEAIPQEIIDKDYGCGDPSRYVNAGDTVLDLGSGAGKACYILAQKVGSSGQVIGIDFNDAMLTLARKYQQEMADKLGYANTRFAKGKIQDLALDLEKADAWLADHPATSVEGFDAYHAECEKLRQTQPLIETESVDVVVSNCVLNLVRPEQKKQLFKEIHRVLRRGGRAVISDIVCDEPPTEAIRNDPKLWSGCIAGAFVEDEFLEMFREAGLYGVEVLERQDEPWHVIDGVEFRSMTVRAFKGKEGPCLERNQAVIYKGPFKQVVDDDGHTLYRGRRMAVCDKTYRIYTDPNGPYAAQFEAVPPLNEVPAEKAEQFDCKRAAIRHPRQTKGEDYKLTMTEGGGCCADDDCC